MNKWSCSPTSPRLASPARKPRDSIGDSVVVFAQGPIGLCATAGAKLMGASLIIGVESDRRDGMSRRMGANVVLDSAQWMSWPKSNV